METKVTSPVVKGLIISLILIVISVVSYATKQSDASWNKWASNIILCGGIIASCIIYANQKDNNVTFGNVFADGFKTGAVITCIVLVFTLIFVMMKPDIKEMAMEKAREAMEKQNSSEADVERGMQMVNKGFYVFMIAGIIVVDLIIAAISALIGAAVAKKNPQSNPF
jgi:predicted nucleic acid-binding protein